MKNLILFLFVVLASFGASAQTQYTYSMTGSGDTLTDTGTDSVYYALNSYYKTVTVQFEVTKISGTVAGTAKLYATVDGSNYTQIATDTLALADVTTNSKIWVVSGSPYAKYKVEVVGVGTQTSSFVGTIYGSKSGAKNATATLSNPLDIVTNTGTGTNVYEIKSGYESLTIQSVVKKTSGTVAGTVTLQGSNDGTNYVTVAAAYALGSVVTFTATDVSVQSVQFVVTGNPYKYIRVSYTGSGTMVATLKSYLIAQK